MAKPRYIAVRPEAPGRKLFHLDRRHSRDEGRRSVSSRYGARENTEGENRAILEGAPA